jgi:CHAD domain-containing protein
VKRDVLKHFSIDLLKSAERNLCEYVKDKNPEHLHTFRLDIKKLNAVFCFAEKTYKNKYRAKELNPLFNKAGKIRELQINIQLLNKLPHPPKRLIEKLKFKKEILKKQFIKNTPRYIKVVSSFRKDLKLPAKLPDKKTVESFFKKAIFKANKKRLNKDKKSIHQYRMKLKKILYVYNSLPHKLQKAVHLNKSEINRLQRKIGLWHDRHTSINFLYHLPVSGQMSKYISILKAQENSLFLKLLITLQSSKIKK